MQLTRFTDYSLRTLICLGLHPERLMTIHEIAQEYDISQAHLKKVVHNLGLRGYIETVRGRVGGIRLARQPELINLAAVVRDTEENMNIRSEEHTSELQSLMRISYAVFFLIK